MIEYKIGDRVKIDTLMFRDSLPEDPTGEIVDINTDSLENPLYQVKVDGYFDQPGKKNTGVLNVSSNGFMYTYDTWPLYANEIRPHTTFHLNYQLLIGAETMTTLKSTTYGSRNALQIDSAGQDVYLRLLGAGDTDKGSLHVNAADLLAAVKKCLPEPQTFRVGDKVQGLPGAKGRYGNDVSGKVGTVLKSYANHIDEVLVLFGGVTERYVKTANLRAYVEPKPAASTFAVGNVVRISDTPKYASRFAGMVSIVTAHPHADERTDQTWVTPVSDRPDGYKRAPFWWPNAELTLISDTQEDSDPVVMDVAGFDALGVGARITNKARLYAWKKYNNGAWRNSDGAADMDCYHRAELKDGSVKIVLDAGAAVKPEPKFKVGDSVEGANAYKDVPEGAVLTGNLNTDTVIRVKGGYIAPFSGDPARVRLPAYFFAKRAVSYLPPTA